MSTSEVLYVKGMNISDTDDDDQWDDKKLNDAYDKAVRVANIEVAKRVAMSTNTPRPSNDRNAEPVYMLKRENKPGKLTVKKDQLPKPSNVAFFNETPKETKWRAGMPCRLVFCEDGLEYEAVISKLIDNEECIVRYLGYENQELVPLEALMPSQGKEARTRQIMEAKAEQVQDRSLSPNTDDRGCSDRMPSPDSNRMDFSRPTEMSDRTSQKKKKSSKKKKNQARNMNINGFELPELPPMPNLSMLTTQLGSAEMPMPPPPMAFAPSVERTDSEEQAISSMLLSWYMSGYYTGLYQGMKRAKEGRRN
ncbi:hypothetical protein PYW08_002565 [Mythimna loreyi]|uniref:Uncharacterized protein n=1 Tax=Mythimna loreyi TaxID=667449 RepID=A0ACC2QKX9_9NEOP|nr:hypothetical protein PYW08_002565 [Mythimna loreyi]